MSTSPEIPPALSRRELARWAWRQLTSMRTALILLLLLALAALPGSFVPQRGVDARAVEAFESRHPDLTPWLDRLGVFDVYTSPWFSAIYLLLMVSLVGCIIPRTGVYLKALRSRPPAAPRRLSRLPASAEVTTDKSVAEVMAAAREVVGRARIDIVPEADPAAGAELRAERGYLREAGNLVFHVSVVVVLVGVAVGALFSYRGAAIVTEGDTFSNVLTRYDEFSSGALYDVDELPVFSLTLKDLTAEFQPFGSPQAGAPRKFEAEGTFIDGLRGEERDFDIRVNHPLAVGSTSVFLVGQGYAPVLRVTDPDGDVVFDEAVPFLPEDGTYTSGGVVKVPDASAGPGGTGQIGLRGFFLPTAATRGEGEASISIFPGAANPYIAMQVWTGDLGLDDGRSQSVYTLDTSRMEQVLDDGGDPFRVELQPGQSTTLPDGTIVEFTDLQQFARFQIAATPWAGVPLGGVAIGIAGLMLSLFIRPRRTWVRARRVGSRTVVEVAALDRVPRDDTGDDLRAFVNRLREALGEKEADA